MRFTMLVLLSSFLVSCSTHTPHKTVAKDKLIRGTVVTFEKRITIENPYKNLPFHKVSKRQVRDINLAMVKKAPVEVKATPGRMIASSCDFVKFCKLNVPKLKAGQNAEVYGNYTVLADGIKTNNHIKAWTLVNADGQEIKITCGVQPQSTDKACTEKLTKVQFKDMGNFLERMMDVRVAAAK